MRKILIVSILLLAMFSAATSSEKHKYNSVNEAIESAYHGGYLPSVASEYIAQAIGLDWEVKNSRPDMGVDIRGYVSNNYEYCILSYAGFGEWGQGGTVEYCALDSTGLVLWTKQSAIASRPAISNSGISVLMTRSDRNEGQKRFLDIVILDKNGKILLKHPVQELLNRPVQRSYFREYYGFTEDGL
ncbi:MAG: hypothetical protein MUF59_00005, partial [Candidatus Krumholzibacteria bacterium]|nr:hypothetical protein [Candidatus Krumholzibacteria bacterium]